MSLPQLIFDICMVGKVVSKFTNEDSDYTYFMNSNNLLLSAILYINLVVSKISKSHVKFTRTLNLYKNSKWEARPVFYLTNYLFLCLKKRN